MTGTCRTSYLVIDIIFTRWLVHGYTLDLHKRRCVIDHQRTLRLPQTDKGITTITGPTAQNPLQPVITTRTSLSKSCFFSSSSNTSFTLKDLLETQAVPAHIIRCNLYLSVVCSFIIILSSVYLILDILSASLPLCPRNVLVGANSPNL